jgi:hypothetical protein
LRHSRAGIAVIIIGVAVLAMAPIWKWAIAPAFLKLPDDISVTSEYEGTLTLYADPEQMVLLPKGQEQVIPLEITRTTESVPEKSDSAVAVIEETVKAVGPDGGTILAWEKFYALDRVSSENVNGYGTEIDREGFYPMLPMGTEKRSYQMWSDDTGGTGEATFVREEAIDGNDYKSVTVYVFEAGGEPEPMVEPPLGLPEELSGQVIKQILGDPSIQIPDDVMLPLEYLKKTEITFTVEPRTGAVVDVSSNKEVFYINAALPGQPDDLMPLAELQYRQTDDNVGQVIDDTAGYFGLLDLATLWLPMIFLIVGLIVVIIGIFIGLRKTNGSERALIE